MRCAIDAFSTSDIQWTAYSTIRDFTCFNDASINAPARVNTDWREAVKKSNIHQRYVMNYNL